MVNVLIADDNIRFATNLMNYLNQKNEDVRVCYIAKNGKEALDILNDKEDVDIVLLDLKMPVFSGIQVLENIKDREKYENSFIIISGEIELTKKLYGNDLIYSIMHKTTEMDEIIAEINRAILNKEELKTRKNIRESIIEELLYLGYEISYKGTQYLISVIEYVLLCKSDCMANLEKEVYPQIAKQYHTTLHNVKANINRATTSMYCECEIERLKKYFTFTEDTKPKIKTIVTTIINKISK